MLLSFTMVNYRSFAHEVTLDLQSPKFQTLHPRSNESWNTVVLKRAAIFGANASGKTNMIRPLGVLRAAVRNSIQNEDLVKSVYDPHKLHQGDPTVFITEYEHQGIRYRWTLGLDKTGIIKERLDANAKRTWRLIFDRHHDAVIFGAGSRIPKAAQHNIEQFLKPTALGLSAWLMVKTPGEFIGSAQWWRDSVLPPVHGHGFNQEESHSWVGEFTPKTTQLVQLLTHALGAADMGITAATISKTALLAGVSDNPQGLSFTEYLRLIEFHHEGKVGNIILPGEAESSGTQAWINTIMPALYALHRGALLIVNKLGSNLHPLLVRELIHYFQDPDINTRGAQLIFTTCDLTLLGHHPTEELDRNEVWLTEKSQSISHLIALSEFITDDNHDSEKRYMQGVFGAVPITTSRGITEALTMLR